MSAKERVRYKKLPGRRRGIFRGSSVWLGEDHLLLVRSWRVREEYRRFYMSDIQSIAVADAPRFHISTRSIGIAWLWLIAISVASAGHAGSAVTALWILAVTLVAAWAYISAKCSCVCRIYTAVSGDDLPSVYRTWTARKFMARVAPQIATAQGTMEDDWVSEVDARRIGPPEFVPDVPATQTTGVGADRGAPLSPASSNSGLSRVPFAEILVALMFTDAIFSLLTLNRLTVALSRLGYGIVAIELGVAVALIVRHARGKPWPGMQWLAIGSVAITALLWWGHPFVNSILTAAANAGNPGTAVAPAVTTSVNKIFNYVDIGSHFLLGLAGIIIILAQRAKTRSLTAG